MRSLAAAKFDCYPLRVDIKPNSQRIAIAILIVYYVRAAVNALRSAADQHDPWTYGDWMINYAGGFVRRGLAGAAIHGVHHATDLTHAQIFFGVNTALYILVGVCLAARFWSSSSLSVLYLFLPSSLILAVWDPALIGRKDIILTAYACGLSLLRRRFTRDDAPFWLVQSLLFVPIVLMHEALAAFIPLIVIATAMASSPSGAPSPRTLSRSVAAASFVPFVVVAMLVAFRAPVDIAAIFASLGAEGDGLRDACAAAGASADHTAWMAGGSACYLNTPLTGALHHVWSNTELSPRDLLLSVVHALVIGLSACTVFVYFVAEAASRRAAAVWLAIGVSVTMPLYFVAVDWGRWLFLTTIILAANVPAQVRGRVPRTFRVWAFALSVVALCTIKTSHGRDPYPRATVVGPRALFRLVANMVSSEGP